MNRENNIELLRIIACLMVIILHVSGFFVVKYMDIENNINFTIGNFFDSLSRPAVPIFLLISGRYHLANKNNLQKNIYYKKIIQRIYIPTLKWSLFYIIFSYILMLIFNGKIINYTQPIKDFLMGVPFFHMWYLFMCVGLFLLVPYLIKLKEKIQEKNFLIFGILMMLLGIIILYIEPWLKTFKINGLIFWNINYIKFIQYLGFFSLGYSLKNIKLNKYIPLILALIGSLAIFIYVEKTRNLVIYEYTSPFVIFVAINLYILFNSLEINREFKVLSERTFQIYFLHAGIMMILIIILEKILKYSLNSLIGIPLLTFTIFFVSNGIVKILKK